MSRLNTLKDRIEAIEALVSIDLDHRRNELTAFDLVSLPSTQLPAMHVQQCLILPLLLTR